MSKGAAFIFGLLVGGGIGSGLGIFFTRKKYKRISREEIDSVKAAYKKYFSKEIEAEMKEEKEEETNAPVEIIEDKAPSKEKPSTLTMYEQITEQQFDELSYTMAPQLFDVFIDGDTDAPRAAVENAAGMSINDILEYLKSNDVDVMYIKNNVQGSVVKITLKD